MTDLTTIVVAHDSGAGLRACLASVQREVDREGLAGEVVLVDNASRDGVPQELASELDRIRLVTNPRNRGFGAAVNQGYQLAEGRRILLLNPDAELCEGALAHLMAALDEAPVAGLAAPALVLPDGTRQRSPRRFYDLAAVLARRTRFGRSAAGRRAAGRHLMTDAPVEAGDVDWVTGAAMLLDRDAIGAAGPFDGRYFLYFEDVDLCRRLRAQGRAVRFEPAARVRHRFGRGSRRQVPWNPLLWHHARSGGLYALRWSLGWWSAGWWRAAGRAALGLAGRLLLLAVVATLLVGAQVALPLALSAILVLRPIRSGRLGRAAFPGLPGVAARLAIAGGAGLALTGTALTMGTLGPLALWALGGAAALDLTRRSGRLATRRARRWGLGHTACLVAGAPEASRRLARALAEQPDEGLEVVGYVPLDPLAPGGPPPRLPAWDQVDRTARDLRVQGVLLAGSADDLARMAAGVHRLRASGVEVAFALTGAVELLQAARPEQLAGHPLLPLGAGADARALGWLTTGLGRIAAAVGLLLLLPLAPVLALASRIASGRSPLVALPRVGLDLRPFGMLRLRSGPGETGERGGGRLGRLLRATHVDELPQLWNVVRGEMCLVGPRPVEPAVAGQLEPWERARFRVRPGITGMWQLDRLRRWRLEQMIASDLLYILRWSPGLDARILVETVLGRRNP